MPSPDSSSADGPVVPLMAAAVVPIRDGPDGLEVLVGQRTVKARFMGGFWVFPGAASSRRTAPTTPATAGPPPASYGRRPG